MTYSLYHYRALKTTTLCFVNTLIIAVTCPKSVEKTQLWTKSNHQNNLKQNVCVTVSIAVLWLYRALKLSREGHSQPNVLFILHLVLLYSSNNTGTNRHRSQYVGSCLLCCLTGVWSALTHPCRSQDDPRGFLELWEHLIVFI